MTPFRDPFGLAHPFFRPLWRRVAVVGVAAGWGTFELVTDSPFWAVLFLAAAAYCAWVFFLAPGRDSFDTADDDDGGGT